MKLTEEILVKMQLQLLNHKDLFALDIISLIVLLGFSVYTRSILPIAIPFAAIVLMLVVTTLYQRLK